MNRKGEVRPIGMGHWPDAWPVCGYAVCHIRRREPQPVTLLVNWYRRPERQYEINRCLAANIANPHIDRIIVAIEPGEVLPDDSPKIVKWVYRAEHTCGYHCSLSFRQWFERASMEPGVKIVANSDVRFDDTLASLRTLDLSGRVLALTRWDELADGRVKFFDCVGSQDAWIFSWRVAVDMDAGMGLPGCDNVLARKLHDQGLRLDNPCRTIRAIHCHASNLRWWRGTDTLEGIGPHTVMGVRPSELRIGEPGDKPRLAILGLAKNVSQTVGGLLDSLSPLTERFECAGWAACGDAGSAASIGRHRQIGFSILPDIAPRPGDTRYSHLARLRNSVLAAMRSSGFDPSYCLALDMDAARLVESAGLAQLVERSDWAAVSVCGLMPWERVKAYHVGPRLQRAGREWAYYDTLALETTDQCRYLWPSGGQWYSHGSGFDPATVFRHQTPPLVFGQGWIRVHSAFGPATFYRASALAGLTYDEQSQQCEHQGLHRDIREAGGLHYIADDIVMEY